MTQQTWTWYQAGGPDVTDIVAMARGHFETEIDSVFLPDPIAYSRNLTLAAVTQFYNPGQEFLKVCRDQDQKLLGYVWAYRSAAVWSDDAMCSVRMVHVDLDLPARDRVQIIREMIMQWELWCVASDIPVVCSTTMRGDQGGFMRIHQRMGYDVRGSYAYKRINKEQK
jgi:hypothetical protein